MKKMKLFTGIVSCFYMLAVISPVCVFAGTGDGNVLSVTKIQDNGSDTQRYNIVIMGDGYQTSEITTFENHAQAVVNAFNSQLAYGPCGGAVNFYRVNIESDDSGVDKPAACYATAINKDTYLDAHYCGGGIQRCIWSSNISLVQTTATNATVNWHFVIVLVNDTENGGCAGGNITFSSTGTNLEQIVMHELGHAIGGLGDEYEYGASSNTYTGSEPSKPNLTIQTNRANVKWYDLILATTPVPTWNQPNCATISSPPVTWNGIVGTYEGGNRHYTCGIYRPEPNCLMRTLNTDFCAVCTRRIQQVLMAFYSESNLAITPWGYFLSPPAHPYWLTPDIWCDNNGNNIQESDEPSIGKSDNHLFAVVTNNGAAASGTFQVYFSYVPFTGVIDMANRQDVLPNPIVSRPSLAAGAKDTVEVLWDLTSIPPQFAGINHFCVIVEIIADECATYDNMAQNNFNNVLTTGPSPAPVALYIKNILDVDAIGSIIIEPEPATWQFTANVPDLNEIQLKPNEEKLIVINFKYLGSCKERTTHRPGSRKNICAREQFDISYKLNGELLGGVSSEIVVYPPSFRKFSLSIHGGIAVPIDNFADDFEYGYNLLVDLDYHFTQELSFVGFFGYNDFKSKTTGIDDNYWMNVSANLKYREQLRPQLFFYFNGGPGYYIPETGDSRFGLNLGAGFNYDYTNTINFELGADYHTIFDEGIQFVHSHAGLIFRF